MKTEAVNEGYGPVLRFGLLYDSTRCFMMDAVFMFDRQVGDPISFSCRFPGPPALVGKPAANLSNEQLASRAKDGFKDLDPKAFRVERGPETVVVFSEQLKGMVGGSMTDEVRQSVFGKNAERSKTESWATYGSRVRFQAIDPKAKCAFVEVIVDPSSGEVLYFLPFWRV